MRPRIHLAWMLALSLTGCAESVDDGDKSAEAGGVDSGTTGPTGDDDEQGGGEGSGADGGGDGSGEDDGGGDGSGDGDDGGSGEDGGSGDGGSGDDGGDDGGEDDGGDDGETEPPPPALPVAGTWSLVSQTLTDDPCGVADFQDPSGFIASTYTVDHVDDETFSLAADGEAPGDCGVVGGETFSCAPAQLREDLSSYGINADMVVDTQLTGVLGEDYLTMSGSTDITVTCDGSCWLVELVLDFPCPMTIDMELAAD